MTARSNLNSDSSYYNFVITNFDKYKAVEASLYEERISPVLDRMQDYTASVARFKIPGSIIPLFRFEPDEYFISFGLNVNGTQLPVPPNPEPIFSNIITLAVNYLKSNYNSSPNYQLFVFYYRQFIQMINITLKNLWDLARGDPAYTAIPEMAALTDDDYPRLVLTDTNPFIELWMPTNINGLSPFWGYTNPAGPPGNAIYIFLNPKLFYFLCGFNSVYFKGGALTAPNVRNVNLAHVLNPNDRDNRVQNIPAGGGLPAIFYYSIFRQDYSSLHNWQKLARIIFTTSMPLEGESIGINDNTGVNYSQIMLTDFEVEPSDTIAARETIIFYPQGELRRYNFTSTGELRKMSIRIFFQLDNFDLIPLLIPPSFQATLKLQFDRRWATNLLQYGNTNSSIYP